MGLTRRTSVCVDCRHVNRTGVDCPTCGEPTRRLYRRAPKRDDDKAWAAIRKAFWSFDNTWLYYREQRAMELAQRWKKAR